MKLFLISDNVDTYMGLRLAGIDGLVLHERDEVVSAIEEAVKDRDLGNLLITEKLIALCPEVV